MWEKHFGLRERIFTPAFDQQLPLLPTQMVAQQQLLETLEDGHGTVLLIGEAGTGKTRLALTLATNLRGRRTVLWMPPGVPGNIAAFYQSLLFDLDLPWQVASDFESPLITNSLRLRLVEWLVSQQQAGGRVLIIADAVQHWPDAVLQEWEHLLAVAAGQPGSMQVLLVARPDLLPRLEREPLLNWAESIGYCVWLEPLDPMQCREHLHHLAQRAGLSWPRLFDDEATQLLIDACQGIVRRLHHAAARALALAFLHSKRRVDAEILMATLEELGLVNNALSEDDQLPDSSAA